MVGYYRRFIPQFSKVAYPLTKLLKKNQPYVWLEAQQRAFDHLRTVLTTAPVLVVPDLEKAFELYTDACGYAIDGVLMQEGRVVAYESRTLNPAEQNYSTYEQELLAIVHALRKWKQYLHGGVVRELNQPNFVVYSDHKPLKCLHT